MRRETSRRGGWFSALTALCLAVALGGPARAEGVGEAAATALVEQFVEAAALGAPDFGGADLFFADKGFVRDASGLMVRDGGGTLVSSPPPGATGPMVMTIAIEDFYGLLVVFEAALAERFGPDAAERRSEELPAVYMATVDGATVMFAFLPGEQAGQKVIGMSAVGFRSP